MTTILTDAAISYTWRQLAHRAGLPNTDMGETGFESLGIEVRYDKPDNLHAGAGAIVVMPCHNVSWINVLQRKENSLSWLAMQDVLPPGAATNAESHLPVLFWGEGYEDGHKPFAEQREDGVVVFYADIVAATFFMLSRWEESVASVRDEHGRFPAHASVAYKQGFLDRPIVDEYALVLQAWLRVLRPGWTPQAHSFSVHLSHDIDSVRMINKPALGAKVLAADLLKRRSIGSARATLQAAFDQARDPYLQGIYTLANLSEEHGFRSAFYFMASDPGPRDTGYPVDTPLMHQCFADLQKRGHELGFHPGYRTTEKPEVFTQELERLKSVYPAPLVGGRQHFLRCRFPDTWRQWAGAGVTYDSTLGFPEQEGFRCGTCHPFKPFDIHAQRQIELLELPLIVMDVTLFMYRKLTPALAEERVLLLARRCQQVGGVFTLLWHNSSLQGSWLPWLAMYRRVLSRLRQMLDEQA